MVTDRRRGGGVIRHESGTDKVGEVDRWLTPRRNRCSAADADGATSRHSRRVNLPRFVTLTGEVLYARVAGAGRRVVAQRVVGRRRGSAWEVAATSPPSTRCGSNDRCGS